MDIQENRISQILADGDVDNEEMQEKSSETIAKYLHYLRIFNKSAADRMSSEPVQAGR